jgi:hypothetical protein
MTGGSVKKPRGHIMDSVAEWGHTEGSMEQRDWGAPGEVSNYSEAF